MSTYSINANLDGLTLAQRDSFVTAVITLGPTKLESMNVREVSAGVFAINANLKLMTNANAGTIITNINGAGADKIIALNVRRVE